jgi:hypothetical protein
MLKFQQTVNLVDHHIKTIDFLLSKIDIVAP